MLDFDTALDLMNKYGYTSVSVHPFIYQDGDTIGICYTYVDEEYGLLERIKIFNNAGEFEEFLKMYSWVQTNGKLHHVRMILDNYEAINPKVMFLRNEKIMVEGEMFDIENYDAREAMRANMDPAAKVIYECGDLLLVYNEIKNRQLQYLKNIVALKNALRKKYYDLQIEVDKYNKVKIERDLKLLPDYADSGINETLEIALKDRYNIYLTQKPSYEEAVEFLRETWELCLNLELNSKYYEAQKEETDIRNETKVVEQKLTLMRSLNDELKPLLGVDLVGRFRKINRECKAVSSHISIEYINNQMEAVNRKYSYFDKLDVLYTSDYLREAIQNSNYADLAIKYAKGTNYDVVSKYKTPLNEVAVNLSVQYRDKLDVTEQSALVLYNNPKYRILCDTILNIPDFEKVPIKNIIRKLNGIKGFSKLKSECYESVRRRIDDSVNQKIKSSLFSSFDFTTFETFITSLVSLLTKLKLVNEKMVLNGDINMYVAVNKVEDLDNKLFLTTTNDIPTLIEKAKKDKGMVGITLLKQGMPVLYSPYFFDLGEIYGKGVSPEMFIKEMINFELLVDVSDVTINIDPNKVNVAKYYTDPNVVENLSIVDDIKMSFKTTFCKYALTSKLNTVITMNQSQAVASNVSPVVNSVFDAGTIATVPSEEMINQIAKELETNSTVPVVELAPDNQPEIKSEVVEMSVEKEIKEEILPVIEQSQVVDTVVVDTDKPVVQNIKEVPVQEKVVIDNVSKEVQTPIIYEQNQEIKTTNNEEEVKLEVSQPKQDVQIKQNNVDSNNVKQEEITKRVEVQDNKSNDNHKVVKVEQSKDDDKPKVVSENSVLLKGDNKVETKQEETNKVVNGKDKKNEMPVIQNQFDNGSLSNSLSVQTKNGVNEQNANSSSNQVSEKDVLIKDKVVTDVKLTVSNTEQVGGISTVANNVSNNDTENK